MASNETLNSRRETILYVFALAANCNPEDDYRRTALTTAFGNMVDEVSSDPLLFTGDFPDFDKRYAFGSAVSSGLKAVASRSQIVPLQIKALQGLAATSVLTPDSVRAVYDIESLVGYATNNLEPLVRQQAIKSLAAIVTNNKLRPVAGATLGNFPGGFDVRGRLSFEKMPRSATVSYQEYAMGVAAHILRTDWDDTVRREAAQALRDIAASNRAEYQHLAASYARQAEPCQTDPDVQAVIYRLYADAKPVNPPGYTA